MIEVETQDKITRLRIILERMKDEKTTVEMGIMGIETAIFIEEMNQAKSIQREGGNDTRG